MKQLFINNLDFTKKQEKLEGVIDAASCERLMETLLLSTDKVTNIQYKLVGRAQKQQTPVLGLTIDAALPMICQRCLEAMTMDFSLNYDYLITETEPEEGDDDAIDWLEPAVEMNVKDLIEDELLVAIPIAPTHNKKCTKVVLESGEKANPFSVLKGLIK